MYAVEDTSGSEAKHPVQDTKSVPFLRVFRTTAFGSGWPRRSSDSVYFRVKFSPGRFAISRRIVPRTIHSPRRNPDARRNSRCYRPPAPRFVDRHVFAGIFGNSIWMPAQPFAVCNTPSVTAPVSLCFHCAERRKANCRERTKSYGETELSNSANRTSVFNFSSNWNRSRWSRWIGGVTGHPIQSACSATALAQNRASVCKARVRICLYESFPRFHHFVLIPAASLPRGCGRRVARD